MPPELAPWISPAFIVAAAAFLYRKIDRLELRVNRMETELRERMAHLEGLLEGLQSAITHRDAA